jgi:GTP pyrophosphokinase
MFLAMSTDIRVILIKMADRLHNMRTLEYLSPEQQKYIAKETKEIYTPLAHRLGMAKIKWELEDLSFRFLEPEKFQEIKNLVAQKRGERETYISNFIKEVQDILGQAHIPAFISGRPKHFYSIYRKMQNQHLDFADVYDLLALRIIMDKLSDCYAAIGLIHAHFKPIPGKFKDYIAMPKNNMYRSLHTTVIGPQGRPVEIQLRTKEMHHINEFGVAAHWKYKEGKSKTDNDYEEKLVWLRQLIEWQPEMSDAKEFMDSLKLDLFVDTVFVFTPKGDVHELNNNATPIDFAYHIHTEVGHRCTGAKVNGQIVPLNHRLINGDIVEILTGKIDSPKRDWLDFVSSSEARSKIKAWLRKHHALEIMAPSAPAKAAKKERTETAKDEKDKTYHKPPKAGSDIVIPGASNILFHIAKCCHPIPGDLVKGLVTKVHGISIHRASCSNLVEDMKTIKVMWADQTTKLYQAAIGVEALDKVGLFSDVLGAISALKINIREANVYTHKEINNISANIIVDVHDNIELQKAINAIQKTHNVYAVHRI